MLHVSLNFIRLIRVVITPSVRGENDSKQSDEFQASYMYVMSRPRTTDIHTLLQDTGFATVRELRMAMPD